MLKENLKVKSWYKVRINKRDKLYTITKQEFKTQLEGIKTLGTSGRFEIMRKKHIEKLELEGFNNSSTVTNKWQPEYLVDESTEKAIAEYTAKKNKEDVINDFLNTPVKQMSIKVENWNGYGRKLK